MLLLLLVWVLYAYFFKWLSTKSPIPGLLLVNTNSRQLSSYTNVYNSSYFSFLYPQELVISSERKAAIGTTKYYLDVISGLDSSRYEFDPNHVFITISVQEPYNGAGPLTPNCRDFPELLKSILLIKEESLAQTNLGKLYRIKVFTQNGFTGYQYISSGPRRLESDNPKISAISSLALW